MSHQAVLILIIAFGNEINISVKFKFRFCREISILYEYGDSE